MCSLSSNPARRARRGLLATALAGWVLPRAAWAAPLASFDPHTWAPFCAQSPRPALVVFTAQTCAVCPGVLAELQHALRVRRATVFKAVVFMDAAPASSTPAARRFQFFNRQFIARGPDLPLRHSVNPAWRGELPYLALLDAQGGVRYIVGAPSPAELDAWLAPVVAGHSP